MATYRALKGLQVQNRSSDPSNPIRGEVWYNTTSGTLKASGGGAWSSGGNMTIARGTAGASNNGTQTACIAYGGSTPAAAAAATNDSYDGTTWTAVNDMVTGRYNLMGVGTQTAAVAYGGKTPPTTGATEEYDGTSWTTNPNAMGGARYTSGQAGTATAALAVAGDGSGGAGGYPATVEEFNGTTWAEVNNFPVTKYEIAGTGTQTAAIIPGGNSVPGHSLTSTTFEYDGTSWAAANAMGTAAGYNYMFGIQTAGKLCGNSPAATLVQDYDGTSWTAGTAMTTARKKEVGAGTQTSGLVAGSGTGPPSTITTTEEFNDPGTTTLTTST